MCSDLSNKLLFVLLDEKEVKQKDSDEEEEPKSKKVSNSSPSSQRVPMFPGLSPSALLVSST